MTSCELCGKKPSTLRCLVEGTMMNVCQDCSRYGDVKGKSNVKIVYEQKKSSGPKEPEYLFVSGYGLIVKNAREKLKLNQEDFAKKISEHKSLIHQVESEHIKPSIIFAKKLEKALNIKIVEEIKDDKESNSSGPNIHNNQNSFSRKPSSQQGLTLGDMINLKKK